MRISNFLKHALTVTAVMAGTSAYAVDLTDLNYTIKPDPIALNDVENIEIHPTLDGAIPDCTSYYMSEYYKGNSAVVNDAVGLKYTDVYFRTAQDENWNNYYVLAFDKAPVEGDYTIVIPEGYFFTSDWDTGDHVLENRATTISFSVGEGYEEPTGFVPQSIYPNAGTEIDSSFIDWEFYVEWPQDVTINSDVLPYVIYDGVEIKATEVTLMAAIKQTNILFEGANNFNNGEYVFVIPAGFCSYADGETNRTWSATYTWKGGKSEVGGDEVKIVAASIGGVNIMEEGVVLDNILPEGIDIVIEVNPEDIEGVWYSLFDVTGLTPDMYTTANAIFTNSVESKNGNVFTKEIYSIEGYKLYEGHDYVVMFEPCYSLYPPVKAGRFFSAVFTGKTEPYRFSDVSILSIEPEPGSEFEIGEKMVVTFSAPVTLIAGEGNSGFGLGNAGWSEFASMKANDDKTVWTITFQNSDINNAAGPGQIAPHIAGVDENGLRIHPTQYPDEPSEGTLVWNEGEEARSAVVVSYDGYAKCPKVIVSPLEADVLSYIDFSIVNDQEIGLSYAAAFPEIKNAAGEVVALVLTDSYDEDADGNPNPDGHVTVTKFEGGTDGKNVELRVQLNNEITTPGIYTLELPWNLFTVGREMSAYASAPGTYEIKVGNITAVETIETENAAAEYYTIDGLKVENPVKGLYIKVVNGKAVKVIL